MSHPVSSCRKIEGDLIAAATGDAGATAVGRVRQHIEGCQECRADFARYRAIDGLAGRLRDAPLPAEHLASSRASLESRLADLRRRVVAYRIFDSPVGPILIAHSEHGISLIEYLAAGEGLGHSRLRRAEWAEPVEDGAEVEGPYRELLEYLEGGRIRLAWPLDFRLARSDFHRDVLHATASIPYGAVTSYTRIAAEIGRPGATRAVAQALRWNPLPIVVPCHRVIGASGALVGYAGDKLGLKRRLLDVEGVPTSGGATGGGSAEAGRVARHAMYVLYPGDEEYCVPTCSSLTPERFAHATLFASRERVEAVGVTPCSACRPDLHPLSR
jgi:methylated-DNA-[protein]-cysteine S-methyltransferase